MQRSSGVLMHISSLWGEYSEGAFGAEALEWVDRLAAAGFGVWQVLPFCLPDEYASPYKSYGAFSLNPYFIDLPALAAQGLLTPGELAEARQHTPYGCEFARLARERLPLLARAASRVRGWSAVEDFLHAHPHNERFCRFMACRAANGGRPWNEWQTQEPDREALRVWCFAQYEAARQWQEVRAYANSRGVRVIGDMPIYVAYDSADVWANRGLFRLNESGKPEAVAGVPPDYFSAEGQLWGNPLYRWEVMREDGYGWWRERMGFLMELFDGVRIDHFRGLESYYAIPAGEPTAGRGVWEPGPGNELIRALRPVCRGRTVIAEDLGDITPAVRRLVRASGFPGMRVLQFAFLGDRENEHRPHAYPENCVAYTGTHDNNTLLGHVWELEEAQRRRLLAYFDCEGKDWDQCCREILRGMLASHAGLVIFPAQDLLGFGSDTRLNTPGRSEGNWGWRMTAEQMRAIDCGRFLRWNRMYGRQGG